MFARLMPVMLVMSSNDTRVPFWKIFPSKTNDGWVVSAVSPGCSPLEVRQPLMIAALKRTVIQKP